MSTCRSKILRNKSSADVFASLELCSLYNTDDVRATGAHIRAHAAVNAAYYQMITLYRTQRRNI